MKRKNKSRSSSSSHTSDISDEEQSTSIVSIPMNSLKQHYPKSGLVSFESKSSYSSTVSERSSISSQSSTGMKGKSIDSLHDSDDMQRNQIDDSETMTK